MKGHEANKAISIDWNKEQCAVFGSGGRFRDLIIVL